MKNEFHLNSVVNKFYCKTYGKQVVRDRPELGPNFDSYNLMSVKRKKRESLPPIIRKALDYLYPAKNVEETQPSSEYDRVVRKLSEVNFEVNKEVKTKVLRRKKRSVDDVHSLRESGKYKSNSQEYINCICYNGQAESEYMLTKQGIKEYTSLYNLYLQDSGLGLARMRPSKSPKKVFKSFLG